ncbi:hypothetical protein [Emticicia fluvialis]|uniref:hypothetical protein n=1 Tax=Emticicia fluvialis TaxID=2974474 RepID=UPI0021664F6B|nr:hypothetical protein [Emticicia fluvialis]
MPVKKTPAQKAAALCLVLLPMLIFGFIFQKYALNIPHWDDLAVRNSLVNFLSTDSLAEKFKVLFAQHNEHRIFLTRIFALLVYQLTDTLQLKWLMVLGNLALAGLLLVFYKVSVRYKLSLWALVPVSFLLFLSSLYENVFWGMASVQNFWVILLAFLSFYFLVFSYGKSNPGYLTLAIVLCFLGVFTSSNGILIPIIGIGLLAFQKRYRELGIWAGAAVVFLFMYFFNYTKPPGNNAGIDFSAPGTLFKGLLAVLGSGLDVSFIAPGKRLDLPMTTGVLLLIIIALFTLQVLFRKYNINQRNNDLFLLACVAFLGITCAGIVAGRLSYGIEVLLTSKYKINSILLLCLAYVILLNSVNEATRTQFIRLMIAGTIVFHFYTYLAEYQNISFLHRERIADQFKIQHSDKLMPTSGIYAQLQHPAPAFYDALLPQLVAGGDSASIKPGVQETETTYIITDNRAGILNVSAPDAGQYFVLRSAKAVYLFASRVATPATRPVKDYLNFGFLFGNQLKTSSFVTEFLRFYIQSGNYQLGMVQVENGTAKVTWTSRFVLIKALKKQEIKQNW